VAANCGPFCIAWTSSPVPTVTGGNDEDDAGFC
jgi:hypothetical protein